MLDKPFCYRFQRFDRELCEHPECSALRDEAALKAEATRAALQSSEVTK